MALSDRETRLLDELVEDSSVDFSAEDRDAIVRAGVSPWCFLRCGAQLVACGGPTNPECIAKFVTCIAACIRG